jgi:hypothetical protein
LEAEESVAASAVASAAAAAQQQQQPVGVPMDYGSRKKHAMKKNTKTQNRYFFMRIKTIVRVCFCIF